MGKLVKLNKKTNTQPEEKSSGGGVVAVGKKGKLVSTGQVVTAPKTFKTVPVEEYKAQQASKSSRKTVSPMVLKAMQNATLGAEVAGSTGTGTKKTARAGSFGGGASTVKETGFTGNRERSQADWGQIAKGVVLQGADQAATGLTSTGAMLEGAVMKPLGQLLGNEELYKSGLLYNLNEYMQGAAESNQERFQPEYEKGGKVGEAVGKYGAATVAAIPQAVIAFMTAGQSMAAQGTTAGLQAAANAAAKGSGIVQTVTAALLSTAKNPSFQYSLASTMGNEFEQAKADGASDMEAYSYAALAGLANSVVEVGGGIDVLPDGSKSALREWVGTMLDEGKEEVIQGAISQLAQAAVYGKKNPLFSTTDQNAVISQQRAGEEFLGGAVVGGILGGGQIGLQSALESLYRAGDAGRQQAAENGADGAETAAGDQINTKREAAVSTSDGRATQMGAVDTVVNSATSEDRVTQQGKVVNKSDNTPAAASDGTSALAGDLDTVAAAGDRNSVTQGTENVNERSNGENRGESESIVRKLRETIPSLSIMEPVSTVRMESINTIEGNTMAEKARRLFDSIKGIVTRQGFGDVEINNRSAKDDLSHGIGHAKAAVIPAIPEVIRNGQQIEFRQNWKGRPYDGYVFAAPVNLDDSTVYVAAVVKRTSKNRLYLHEVVDSNGNIIKMDNGVRANQTSLAAEGGAGTQTPMSTVSVPQGNEYVNAEGVTGNGEGSDLFDGGQGRVSGAGTGEQAGILEKGTAGGQQRNVQNVRAGDRADAVAWAYQRAGAAPVSTRELLGTALGTEDAVLREAPVSVIREDSELQSVYDQIKNAGYRPHLFTGRPMLEGGQEVSGMIRGEDVYIRIDHTRHTPEQIWKHEQFHAMAENDQDMVLESWQKLLESADRGQIMHTMKVYREKYHGIYDVDENGNTVWDETVMRKIVEEILADAYAGKDTFGRGVSRYTDTVKNMVQQRSEGTREARGPPEGRFTFAGQKARTADSTSLWNAERMEEAGRSAEDIRQETGWFRGMDGQWRFEIDDSGMEFRKDGDARLMQEEGYQRLQELTDKWEKAFEGGEDLTQEETLEMERLQEDYADRVWQEKYLLRDFLRHDELFQAYPYLNRVSLVFDELPGGTKGYFSKRSNTIVLSDKLFGKDAETVLHEIQHVIQKVEGFTPGSSPEYWAVKDSETGEINRGLREEYDRTFRELSPEEQNQFTRYQELERVMEQLETAEEGTPEAERYIRYERESDQLYLNLWEKSWFQKLLDLDRKIKNGGSEEYQRLYRNTAGEIEARDAANRRWYTKEQRRNTPPDLGDENTVFADREERFSVEDDRAEASGALDTSLEDLFQDADRKQVRSVADLIRAGATDQQLQDAFDQLYDSARVASYEGDAQELGEIVKALRGRRVYIDPDTKAEFGDDWNSFRQQAFGRGLYFTNNQTDTGLDALNDELAQQFPGYFSEAETDPSAIMERILDTFQRAKGKQITLDEEARQFGGEDAAQAFREDYRQRFMDAAEQYRDTMRGLDEEQKRQRQQQRDQKRAELDRYVSEARQTLRDRAAEGMPVSGTALPGPENKAYDIDEYLEGLRKKAEAERARRLRNITKAEFKGTAATDKLGIRIEGSVTDYTGAAELRARQKAAESVRRELKKAEKRLGATAEEKRFASDVAAGIYTEDMIPASMDADKIMELADYYMAERAQGVNMIRQRKADINRVLDERMEVLFKDSDKYKPSKAVVLNNRTPQRNMLKIFGDQQGKIINEQIFDPVAINEAERIRFVNKQFDKVRTFTGQDGKQSKLSKQERALTQMVMEGRAVQEIVAGMEMGEAIKRAGENIYNGADLLDGAAEFGLDTKERDLARKYARWLEAQDALENTAVDKVKVENAATVYSELFDQYYDAINDFLVVHGYEPIGFIKGYAPHLQPEQNQTLLNKAFQSLGVNTDVTTLPASIAGMTADYKPGKKWNPYFLQRTSDVTEYDIASGFESYVNYLSDVLYHTDDIMRVRRAERYFRKTYAPEEIRNNIEWAEGLRNLKPAEKLAALRDAGVISTTSAVSADDLSVKMEDYISGLYEDIQNTSKYSEFAVYLDNYANILAGKQSMADRGWEYGLGRGIMNVGNKLTRAFARAQVAGNLSSALNQTAQIPQIMGENGMVNTLQAAADMMSGKLKRAGFAQESDVLTGKQGIKYLVTDPGDMVTNALFTPAQLMDGLVSTLAVRGAYNKAVKEGKSHQEAMKAADDFGNKVMGSRMKGSRPLAFEAKNPVSQMAHIFQLEALNSWEHMTQDLPRDFREIEKTQGKDKAALALAGVIVKTLLSAFLLNRLSEEAYGGTPAPFDLLGLSANFVASGEGLSTNEYLKTVIDNGWEQLTGERFFDTDQLDAERDFDLSAALDDTAYNVMNDVPFVRNIAGLLGLGDQTLPWPDIYGGVEDIGEAISSDGLLSARTGEAALNLGLQVVPGGRQISKTYSGAKAMLAGGKTSGYGDNARMQYPVERSPANVARGLLFGVNALPESRDFYAGGMEGSLSAKQTQLYNDLVDAGADGGEVFEILNDVKDAETTIDKIMEIADTAWDETIKEMALENFMGEKQFERYMAARDAGILTYPYAEFLAELNRETVQRTGKSGSASQEDVIAALEGTSFTKQQKTAIWNSYGWKKESPWG